VGPSEFSDSLLDPPAFPPTVHPLVESVSRSEFSPAAVSPALVRQSRSAVGTGLGCGVFPRRTRLVAIRYPARSSLRVHSPLEFCPANPTPRAAARGILSWTFFPYSTSGYGGPSSREFHVPIRSTFRVWLPSWRLTPSEPLPALFHARSALGITPSELSPPGRYRRGFPREEPAYRLPGRLSNRTSILTNLPPSRDFRALPLPGIPAGKRWV
jgi:hypothetical protein